jgi:hypothetical protein
LICAGRASEAEGVLRGMLGEGSNAELRLHLLRNLQWALNRQRQYEASVELGKSACREYPDDWQLRYNLAVSSACAGNRTLFEETARQLGKVERTYSHGTGFCSAVVEFEANRFAEKLRLPVRDVLRVFGVKAGSAHDAS